MIKPIEYYKILNDNVRKDIEKVEYHIRVASGWKAIYEATKNKRGYRWLNRIACRRNTFHYVKGMKISVENLSVCLSTIDELSEFLKAEGS